MKELSAPFVRECTIVCGFHPFVGSRDHTSYLSFFSTGTDTSEKGENAQMCVISFPLLVLIWW